MKKPAQAVGPRNVRCYHCGRAFEISAKAMTVSCPGCFKSLLVDDVDVKTTQAVRKLQTCGRLTVHARGRVIADLVEAHGGLVVRGVLDAKVYRGGPVAIGPRATWRGDCHAPALKVEAGAVITSGRFVIPDLEVVVADALREPAKKAAASTRESAADAARAVTDGAPSDEESAP